MKPFLHMSVAVFFLVLFGTSAHGQDEFQNTMTYDSAKGSPPATLEDVAWVQGHWKGEAFGGITEEVWTPPLGNSMMCAFKLVVKGEVRFYEMVALSEENGTLMLRLKHFHGNLKGWEEKDETVDFPLVKVTPGKVFFDGFTFERVSENALNIYVVIESRGKQEEMKFAYTRVQQEVK